ncbi:MAG: hypothetical protein ACPGLV_04975 [Bacteroidia bacterium]
MKIINIVILSIVFSFQAIAQNYSPFYNLGTKGHSISQTVSNINKHAVAAGFDKIGAYAPGNQDDLYVLVFTNSSTISITSKAQKQGVMAATYRIGLELIDNKVQISAVNPVYQWISYLGENYKKVSALLKPNENEFLSFCKTIGNGSLTPFGGKVKADDLEEYQYMFGMPYYNDQEKLAKFSSHSIAKKTIENKLKSTPGIVHIYTLKDPNRDVIIYGVGLVDQEKGEKHFLSIIGQKHVAALPYELILEDNEAKMLHGRFRFALYWPELTMGTFTQIMSTPGDVEDMLEQLVE